MREKTTAGAALKSRNKKEIFDLLRGSDGLTRQQIADALYLSLPTVNSNLENLLAEGLIEVCGDVRNTGGRRALTYGLHRQHCAAIGMDVRKHHISVVAIDLGGEIVYQKTAQALFEKTDAYYRYLGELTDACIREVPADRILGVGIGVPGLITPDGEKVFVGEILHFGGTTRQELSRYISCPTVLINDAKAAAFAESHMRGDIRDFFYIMLSNNVGGAIIRDGKLLPGDSTHSAEAGHICLDPNGLKCYCGQRGCSDAYLAATVLSQLTNERIDDFFQLLAHRAEPTEACPATAEEAERLFDTYITYLARAVNTVYMLFDCPVVLGGYVGSYLGPYMQKIRERTAAGNLFSTGDFLQTCVCRKESIAFGSAMVFLSEFLKSVG